MNQESEAQTTQQRRWVDEAIKKLDADFNRSADTHLLRLQIPAFKGIDFYFKDESSHPTGSLKHRLARSLFLYGMCSGWIRAGTTIIEASSGSTAVSEAYFAKLLGLPFIAVMPRRTSQEKIQKILFYGGKTHLVDDPSAVYTECERLARESEGHFMDQFTYAERATDWRGNNNIAESIFSQMRHESHPTPTWLVCGAGTGGTSATLGRFVRYRGLDTKICVVDPEGSVFAEYHNTGNKSLTGTCAKIEGIGRPRVEPSFIRDIIDRMARVPDAASIAAMRVLETLIGKKCGGSTGTNFYGVLQLASEMLEERREGSIVTLICDAGERYLTTCYSDRWVVENGLKMEPYVEQINTAVSTGRWGPIASPTPDRAPAPHVARPVVSPRHLTLLHYTEAGPS